MKKKRSLGFDFEQWKDVLLPNYDLSQATHFEKNPWMVLSFTAACLVLFFAIFIRLFHLQIIEGAASRELADGNRIQIKIIHAPRGVIFDRNGKILAANSPAFRLGSRLISREEALALEVKEETLEVEVDNVRDYLMGEEMAHVIGYVGGDRIGQTGIEAQYEKLLRGIDGGEIIEVDSRGLKLRTLRTNPPIPGQNIYLTIDADLQSKVYSLLKQTLIKVGSLGGAAIVMDPTNGQILALVSLPSFDPNIFTKSYDEAAISQLFSSGNSPILNRVIAGTYPPGSTFKIVSSLAALSSGKVTADTTIEDSGVIYLGPYKFTNWYFTQYGKTEGSVNLQKAIQRSNDTYFYYVGQIVGEQSLADWARKIKLGQRLGIDLPGETAGLIPDDNWKKKTFELPWYPGDTLHLAIGQGFVLTTPLQILGMTAFIAADGVLYQPRLVLTNFKPKVLVSNVAAADRIKLVKDGLKLVPKLGGTAWPFFTFPIPTAGKTGTAEFENGTHAWYTSYAPADNPKLALTVLVEDGGEGSSVAAPIAKEVYRWYFSPDKNKLIQDVYESSDSGKMKL